MSLFFERSKNMKEKTIFLIDGENISYKKADQIDAITVQIENVTDRKVYHRWGDPITRAWTELSKARGYKDICLFGGPEKNKIDRKMQKDARRYLKEPEIGAVYIVTSDADFRCLAKDACLAGKRLCFIGEKKAPEKLRLAGSEFIELE